MSDEPVLEIHPPLECSLQRHLHPDNRGIPLCDLCIGSGSAIEVKLTVATLRRDLATRDRELAELRRRLEQTTRLYEAAEIAGEQARAALAEKEREYRELGTALGREQSARVDLSRALAAAQEEAKGLRTRLDGREAYVRERLATILDVAVEPLLSVDDLLALLAQRFPAALALLDEMKGQHNYRDNCEWPPGSGKACTSCRIVEFQRALAARQQQPDGKPDPAPVASETALRDHVARHKEGDEGP